MVLDLLSIALLVVGLVGAIVSALSSRPKHQRNVAQEVSILAIAGVLLIEAHERSGWSH